MIAQVLLPAGLAFIMLTLGLKLGWRDFAAVLAAPRALFSGLALQLLALPALAAAILLVWRLPPDQAVGLMVLAACPGGITSNLLVALARGDTALSITMTGVSSLACLIGIPLAAAGAISLLEGSAAPQLQLWPVTRGVLVVATVPVIIGMAIGHWAKPFALAVERWARPLSTAIFAAIVVATFAAQWSEMVASMATLGPAVLALNLGIMGLGSAVSRGLGLDRRQTMAIVIEGGLRNAALGILVSVALLGRPTMSVPSITYALVMNITVLALLAAVRMPRRATAPSLE